MRSSLLALAAAFALASGSGCGSWTGAGTPEPDAGADAPPEVPAPPAEPPCTQLTGLGAECLELAVPFSDLKGVEVACTARTAATIVNRCDAAVVLAAVDLSATSDDLFLAQSPAIPECGLELAPGASIDVAVGFRPSAAGVGAATISIEAMTPAGPESRSWSIETTSLPLPTVTEEHVAKSRAGKGDLLIVIDNGISFADHLPSLRTNLAAFAKYVRYAGMDAQLAFTLVADTGTTSRGELVGLPDGTVTFHAQSPTFESDVAQVLGSVEVGASSHDALAAASLALAELDGLCFARRHEAGFGLFFVTDSAEQSPSNAYAYLSEYLRVTDSSLLPRYFAVFAIAGFAPDSACVAGRDDGRYALLVNQTSGIMEDLCTADWHKAIEGIAEAAFGWREPFPLQKVPAFSRGPIKVTIDSVEVPTVDNRGATAWQYDPIGNAVVFEPLYLPEPGQLVRITYPLPCPGAD